LTKKIKKKRNPKPISFTPSRRRPPENFFFSAHNPPVALIFPLRSRPAPSLCQRQTEPTPILAPAIFPLVTLTLGQTNRLPLHTDFLLLSFGQKHNQPILLISPFPATASSPPTRGWQSHPHLLRPTASFNQQVFLSTAAVDTGQRQSFPQRWQRQQQPTARSLSTDPLTSLQVNEQTNLHQRRLHKVT